MDISNLQPFQQQTSNMHSSDFDLHEFINHVSFEEFIDQVREDFVEPIIDYGTNYYHGNFHQQQQVDNELMYFNDGARYNKNQLFPTPGDLFELINNYSAAGSTTTTTSDPISLNPMPSFGSIDIDAVLEEDEENEGDDYSSGTTSTRPSSSSSKRNSSVDNSRILGTERRRRVQMKHNLYTLRALVPNITKMDKASIIGDAVSYVQDLQKEAKRLKTEIAELEPTLTNQIEKYKNLVENPEKNRTSDWNKEHQICKKIVKMDVFQVEENEFYVRIICNKGDGVAVYLYKALESLTSFDVQSSKFATFPDKLDFTFTLNVKECGGKMMNLSNMKLWLNEALLNQGFV
ncbi:hypothetical protein C5167_028702 [Papaver somniferum]|uniref:transcription factor FER-LIKE IRON DEFICIENCY-INDUCED TRANSCRIPTION FACTOR-like n=1 Tax=Papaver somniferum TaxID=3469 RepID=UPI000E6FB388|nr:transcription factor FER-LIKE IRON DEFICIENCY-INDUCED TRANSCRIPTION FACTOR-like [Papaver somniferum]RZC90870.1 hypothetical protein C5167_028702 [Papaver somniferum]